MKNEIEKFLKQNAIDFFGIGDLKPYSRELIEYGFPISKHFTISVSIGIILVNEVVNKLSIDSDIQILKAYRYSCYDLINERLNNTLSEIVQLIKKQGYDAVLIPATVPKDKDRSKLFAEFSHKAAARISGLGWIGKNCMLINPEVGPRARWGTVLTNAPFSPTGSPIEEKCDNCNICVEQCPAGAFTGRAFKSNEKREVRYDAFKCDEYQSRREKTTGYRVCGICIKVCPYGRNY